MKKSISFLMLILTVTFFTNCKTAVPGMNSEAQKFLERYNKEKFLQQIEEQRSFHNKIVVRLKEEGKTSEELKLKYVEVQSAYNNVLDKMITDVKKVKNIIGFQTIDANNRYSSELNDAKIKGDAFVTAASQALNDDSLSVALFEFAISKIWPLVQKVHDKYLAYTKLKMESRINETKYQFWENIN